MTKAIILLSVIIALEKNMAGLEDWWWQWQGKYLREFVGHDVSEDLTLGHWT